MNARGSLMWLAALLGALPGCAGSQGDGASGSRNDMGSSGAAGAGGSSMVPEMGGAPGVPALACDEGSIGAPLLRRLTALELNASLRDVFALPAWPGLELTPDEVSDLGFNNAAERLHVNAGRAEQVLDAAEDLVATLDWPTLLARVPECGASPASAQCARAFIAQLGRRLFRRALPAAELDLYQGLWGELQAQSTFDDALRWSTVALIQSPHTLYRSELGQSQAQGMALDGYEIASALSYTFAGTTPSEELLLAAENGELADATARATWAAQLQRLPSGQAQFQQFLQGWLRYEDVRNLAKSTELFPEFAGVQAAMVEETRAFVEHVVFQMDGTVEDLLTAPITFVNGTLGQYYGFAAQGDAFSNVTRPMGRGVGLLAQGSMLSRLALPDGSSPTQRGAFVREKLLCEELPPPPANVAAVPEFREGVTTRQRYEELHTVDPGCAGCHRLTDQVGFAFEHFDGAGRYREMEAGQAIDASGQLVGRDLSFNGQEEAMAAIAQLPQVEACVLLHWASFASGIEREGAECLAASLQQSAGAGVPLADAMAHYAAIEHFAQRR